MSDAAPQRRLEEDPGEPELVVHPPRLVEMSDEQHQTAVRLLVALIDARLARRRAAGSPMGGQRRGVGRAAPEQ